MCSHMWDLCCFESLYSFSYIHTVNWSVADRRMPFLLQLLSNHPCPHGCSMFSVVHLCLISPVYSYSSEITDQCFQGCALTRHQLHQQATSHTESIRDCCLCVCVCGFTSKKGVVKRQEWLRWRWHWLGSISNTSRSRTLYKHKYMHRHSSYTGLKEFLKWKWFCYTMPSYVWPLIKSASCLLKNKKSPHGCTLKNYTHIHRHTLHACMNTA